VPGVWGPYFSGDVAEYVAVNEAGQAAAGHD